MPSVLNLRRSLLVLWCALVPVLAWAAPPTEESVERLFKAMNAPALMEQMLTNVVEPMLQQAQAQMMNGKVLSDAQKRRMAQTLERIRQLLRAEFRWENMRTDQIGMYRDTFEQWEIDGMIAFYEGPVGQSFLRKTPELSQKSLALTQAKMAQAATMVEAALRTEAANAR